MNPGILVAGLVSLVLAESVTAQHGHPRPGGTHGHGQDAYAGMTSRTIKALSDHDIADLRAGRGMSMALPAELNGYPGPLHVLELAEQLKLSDSQRRRTRTVFEQMQEDARSAGEEVIAAEAALDALFRNRLADPASVSQATSRAAVARGRLRETHLRHHLLMMDVLAPEQIALYSRLRGY